MAVLSYRKKGGALEALQWQNGALVLLDQTQLPGQVKYITCRDPESVADAIKSLQVRGAPLIGAAAAFGLVLGAKRLVAQETLPSPVKLREIAATLLTTRPTAVNLRWALERMLAAGERCAGSSPTAIITTLEAEALAIAREDVQQNQRIGAFGASLIKPGSAVLTHCNAGALATMAYGTALGVIRAAWQRGLLHRVFVDETRPLLQGARLTAWELTRDGIPVTLIVDNMAGWVMRQHLVQAVIVGADRIAANGDTANKIGTYSLALLARAHGLPFYVAAPRSTFDITLSGGTDIPIEERSPTEITHFAGIMVAPADVTVYNPAFDVTPAALITAIITECGVLTPPYNLSIAQLKHNKYGKESEQHGDIDP